MADRTTKVTLTAQISNYIAGMEKAAASTKAVGTAAEKLTAQKEGFTQVGHAILAIGAVAAAGVGLAIVKFAEFDAKMSQVKTLSHASAGEMAQLTSAALSMGQAIGFSATEVADAEVELVKAGVSVKDIMGGALKGALELAAAGQIDVAQATEIATIALTQFKLKGSDVPHVADLLAAGADKALGGVSDLGEALKSGGLVASQFGVSLEETVGTLSAFANAGLLGETAGTDLRQMLLKLANPSKQAADDMSKYGITLYDVSGKFVGISDLAGQLHDKLGGLDDATRNSALATIFGARAIAGANVLYNEGAAGIAKWTKNVNDQGFAALQAAGKMDNLQGDIKKLGAAFDTDLIKTGSTANGVLRDVAQTITGLVTAFGNIPAGAQGTLLAVGAVVAVIGLVGGTALIAVPKIAAFKDALLTLGTSMKTVTIAGGAVGLAIAALSEVVAAFGQAQAEITSDAQTLADTLDQQTGAITKNTRAFAANKLAKDGTIEAGKKVGLSSSQIVDAYLGQASATSKVNAVLKELGDTSSKYYKGQQAGKVSAQDLIDAHTKLQGLIGKGKVTMAQAKDVVEALGGATSDTASNMKAASKQVDAVTKATDNATTSLDDFAKALAGMGQVNLSATDAQIKYVQSLADASAALDKNGATLDINTQAGRDNMSALDNVASSAHDLISKQAAAGTSTETLTGNMAAARQAFIDTAEKMGATADQANNLADQYHLIPTEVKSNAELTGVDAAKAEAATLQAQLEKIAKDWTIPVHIVTTGAIPAGARAAGASANANGGMYAYADSGFGAGIYSGGAPLYKFAEPETRWEAFISGKQGEEPRARQVWTDVGHRLGMNTGAGGGGATVVSLAGATILMSVDGRQMTAVIQDQIVQNDRRGGSVISTGKQKGF